MGPPPVPIPATAPVPLQRETTLSPPAGFQSPRVYSPDVANKQSLQPLKDSQEDTQQAAFKGIEDQLKKPPAFEHGSKHFSHPNYGLNPSDLDEGFEYGKPKHFTLGQYSCPKQSIVPDPDLLGSSPSKPPAQPERQFGRLPQEHQVMPRALTGVLTKVGEVPQKHDIHERHRIAQSAKIPLPRGSKIPKKSSQSKSDPRLYGCGHAERPDGPPSPVDAIDLEPQNGPRHATSPSSHKSDSRAASVESEASDPDRHKLGKKPDLPDSGHSAVLSAHQPFREGYLSPSQDEQRGGHEPVVGDLEPPKIVYRNHSRHRSRSRGSRSRRKPAVILRPSRDQDLHIRTRAPSEASNISRRRDSDRSVPALIHPMKEAWNGIVMNLFENERETMATFQRLDRELREKRVQIQDCRDTIEQQTQSFITQKMELETTISTMKELDSRNSKLEQEKAAADKEVASLREKLVQSDTRFQRVQEKVRGYRDHLNKAVEENQSLFKQSQESCKRAIEEIRKEGSDLRLSFQSALQTCQKTRDDLKDSLHRRMETARQQSQQSMLSPGPVGRCIITDLCLNAVDEVTKELRTRLEEQETELARERKISCDLAEQLKIQNEAKATLDKLKDQASNILEHVAKTKSDAKEQEAYNSSAASK
jgi:hypothetical protein